MKKLYKTEEERKAQRAEYQRRWRTLHPTKVAEYRLSNLEERREASRVYHQTNRTKIAVYKKQHREENKDRYNEKARERYRKNPLKDRAHAVKRKYGITVQQIEQMLIDQNNQCKTCEQEFIKTPHIDHNHKTGEVRGLLCGPCNRALGLIKESPETLKNMILLLGSSIHTISTENSDGKN